jgi:hypothetical protein
MKLCPKCGKEVASLSIAAVRSDKYWCFECQEFFRAWEVVNEEVEVES